MGVTSELEKSTTASQRGLTATQRERQERKRRERVRARAERLLGTERQFKEDFLEKAAPGRPTGRMIREYGEGAAGKRQRAREQKLRERLAGIEKAEKASPIGMKALTQKKAKWQEQLDRLVERTSVPELRMSADEEARRLLSSPTGEMVGENLLEARRLGTEEGRAAFEEDIAGGALEAVEAGRTAQMRGLATAQREAQSQIRQLGMRRAGGGATGLAAIAGRTAERFGTARANVELQAATNRASIRQQAATTYITTARAWRADAITFAQQWLDNVSGIRNQFNADMMGYGRMVQASYQNLQQAYMQSAQLEIQHQQVKAAAQASMMQGAASLLGVLG